MDFTLKINGEVNKVIKADDAFGAIAKINAEGICDKDGNEITNIEGLDLRLIDERGRTNFATNEFINKYCSNYTKAEWERLGSFTQTVSDKPSVYFDIDGTLGKWNGKATMEEIFDLSNHYFAKIEPDDLAINLAMQLHEDGVDVCIISAADLLTIPDKYDWIKEHLPFIEDENIFFAPIGADKTQFIKGNADISVLIDDYNPNLYAWKEAGGHSVKYLNGINSKNPDFGLVDFEALRKAQDAFHEWELITDATDYQIEQQQSKLVSRIYNTTGFVADGIEQSIGHNSPAVEHEKE